jgi:segregation and condensation protein B
VPRRCKDDRIIKQNHATADRNAPAMDISNLITHIEALIFASEKPLTSLDVVELINNAFGFLEDKITLDQVESAVEGIQEKYGSDFYPFELRQSGGGWQFLTKREYHKTIAQLNGDKFLKRLSNAAMETLAIIAYKQPITKSEIETIRGVSSDYSIQKLLEKELIIIKGRHEHYPGKPLVYGTSRHFMDYFGLNDPNQLPKIDEVLAEQFVEPTLVNADHFEFEPGAMLTYEPASDMAELAIRSDRPEGTTSPSVEMEAALETVSMEHSSIPDEKEEMNPESGDDKGTEVKE